MVVPWLPWLLALPIISWLPLLPTLQIFLWLLLLLSLPTLGCPMVDMVKRTLQKFLLSLLIFRILFLSVFNTTFVYTFLNLLFVCIAQLQLCYRVPFPHKLNSKHQNIFGFPYYQWQCDKARSTTQLRNNCKRLKYKYYFWKRLSQWAS